MGEHNCPTCSPRPSTVKGTPTGREAARTPTGRGWSRVRRQALERDDYECVVCGRTAEALGRNPDVHHIVPVRLFDRADEWTK